MYEQYWSLQEKPFANNFDSRFTFASKEYEEVVSRLTYADLQNHSLVVLTGEIGSGKSFVLRNFADALGSAGHTAAILVNPMYGPTEFLRAVAREYGLDDIGTEKVDVLGALQDFARENHFQKSKTYLVVDEAQTIEDPLTWEEIRLLLNYSEEGKSLFRIILSGTPNFIEKVKDVPGLWQRIELKCSLGGLHEDEIATYLRRRVSVAGSSRNLFDDSACRELFALSEGLPREINVLADLALLGACGEQAQDVTAVHITRAAEEMQSAEITDTLAQYVGSSSSRTVHLSRCIEVPQKKHQVPFESLQSAIEAGFAPCKLCIRT